MTDKIFWLQPEDTRIGAGQRLIGKLTGSNSFCALPWIHMATRPNGDMRLCCVSNASGAATGDHEVGLVKKEDGTASNFGRDLPLEAWNSEYMRSVRKTFLEGKVPSSCSKCFEEESNGVVSKRLWEMYEWNRDGLDFNQLIKDTTEDGIVPEVIRYFDFRLGHTCNLKCVMCSPHDSSRWVQDNPELIKRTKSTIVIKQIEWDQSKFNNYWYENPAYWEQVYNQIPNITQLYFAGGEPLMIKEHKRLLLEIIDRGYAKNISLRYNSNGLFVSQEIIDIWSQFKRVRYAFSLDAITDRNNYIRYPSDWKKIEESLWMLDDTPDHIHTSIACTVQVLNISHIIDFAKWKLQQGFKKINKFKLDDYETGGGIINLHLLFIPTFLSARILPVEMKLKLQQDFNDFKQWLWDNYTQDDNFWNVNPYGWKRWEAILKFVMAEDHSHILPDFKEYVHNLDDMRGLDSTAIFPELSSILQ